MGCKSGSASTGCSAVLAELHGAHPGMTRMKALARQWVWWPNLDQAIEDVVKSVNRTDPILHQLHCTPGSGPHTRGRGYMLTSQDPWMVRCSL